MFFVCQRIPDRLAGDCVCREIWIKFSGLTETPYGVILEIQKGSTDRRFAPIVLDNNRQLLRVWRLFLCFMVFAESISSAKTGQAKAQHCQKINYAHWHPLLICIRRDTALRCSEGKTAYRYGSTFLYFNIIRAISQEKQNFCSRAFRGICRTGTRKEV